MKKGSCAHLSCATLLIFLFFIPDPVFSFELSIFDDASVDLSSPQDHEPSFPEEEDGEKNTAVTFKNLVRGSRVIVVLKDGTEIKGILHQVEPQALRLKCERNAGFGQMAYDYPVVSTSDILRIEAYRRSWSNIGIAALLVSGLICIWVISIFTQ